MSVSAAVGDSEGRRRVMLRRWEKADLVMWLTWGRNERVGSKVTARLWIWVEGVTMAINIECEILSGSLGQLLKSQIYRS